jgi:hypothetical protein
LKASGFYRRGAEFAARGKRFYTEGTEELRRKI